MRVALLAVLVILCAPAAGCVHLFPDVAERRPSRGMPAAAADRAVFAVMHGNRGETGPVVFAADGTPLCQVPPNTHCVISLVPGHHRLYLYWNNEVVDAFDLDVLAGRRYFATMNWGYHSPVDEKLTPALDRWVHLDEWLATSEMWLDVAAMDRIRADIVDFDTIRRAGDGRFAGYPEHQVEVHTIRPEDGV